MLIPIVFIVGIIIYTFYALPKGDTVESREELLNNAISGAKEWSIVKETKIDGYIISCAYSSNGKSTIAVFEPVSEEKHKFSTSTNRDNEEIIIGGTIINGKWYDLIWFNGVQTEYAEIIYSVNGETKEPLKYDTSDMDIICIQNSEKDYSINVTYYDKDGNKYE